VGWQPRVPDRGEVAPYRRRALIGPATFGIFDAFADDTGRKAHLAGPIAAALMAKASELLAEPPQIEQVDVLGAKIPH
jgi:quinol monooxygenase YgiN